MCAASRTRDESDKGELRRQQVLEAATECFRREGFHGSSIARISQAAGMSPGHIYHYFANKEAIVEAIAEREEHDIAELLRKLEQDREGGGLVDMLTRQTAEIVERNTDPAYADLMLELAAEAARNPAVRKILQRSDREISSQFFRLIERVGAPPGLDAVELQMRLQMISMMFNGLPLRVLGNPDFDLNAAGRLINEIIRFLLAEQPPR